MSGSNRPPDNEDHRAEMIRLREENLRLRERALQSRSMRGGATNNQATVVNVKQVNEGLLSGCATIIGLFIAITFVLAKCSG